MHTKNKCKAPDCRLGCIPAAWEQELDLEEGLWPPQEALPEGPCQSHTLLGIMLVLESMLAWRHKHLISEANQCCVCLALLCVSGPLHEPATRPG